jgi:endoglucanase
MKTFTVCRVMQTLVMALIGLSAGDGVAAGYFAQAGKLYDGSGAALQIRGISHFGFNSGILQPQYLWAMGWKEQIAQIKSLGFNAVRVPFVPDTLYNTTPVDKLSYVDPAKNPELLGKTPLQALDLWMAEADRQGLYVLLDFHSVSMQRQYPTWYDTAAADLALIYNGQAYTADDWIRDLTFVAKRYASLPHFFAIDIDNEPNGVVRWSTGDPNATNPANFWKDAAERASAAVLAANPALLIFVQGINGNFDGREDSSIAMNWGEDFQPEAYQPLNIPAGKLVLSPHTYGPDVYVKKSFSAAGFPANLAADWEKLFGQFYPAHPVVPGEWGGKYGQGTSGAQDITWQNAFVDYLLSKGMHDSFYWCYTPNSGDTGGILDDQLAVRQDKLALLQRLWGTTASSAPAGYVQPVIGAFTPTSGAAGTTVTVSGSGFTGADAAWIGATTGAAISVTADTKVQITVPANATTGVIAILNPSYKAVSAAVFTVTSAPPPASPPPAPPTLPPVTVQATPQASGGGGSIDTLALIGLALAALTRAVGARFRV